MDFTAQRLLPDECAIPGIQGIQVVVMRAGKDKFPATDVAHTGPVVKPVARHFLPNLLAGGRVQRNQVSVFGTEKQKRASIAVGNNRRTQRFVRHLKAPSPAG